MVPLSYIVKLSKALKNSYKPNHLSIGTIGENIAEKYLKNKNYNLICKNWRCKIGEIDLIFKDGSTIVFVEVKTRIDSKYSNNIFLNITSRKQKKLKILSEIYYKRKYKKLSSFERSQMKIRIDAIGVILNPECFDDFKIRHIVGAI
jgi:putative endonuclease